MDRREAIKCSALLLAGGCGNPFSLPGPDPDRARLATRPHSPNQTLPVGRTPLGLGGTRDGFVYVPNPRPTGNLPLILLLHGAGGSASSFNDMAPLLDELGVAALAIDSRDRTWDMIGGLWGGDVDFIDRALDHVFDRLPIDPAKIALAGFSDGASYALSLGLPNGTLFTDIMAWSPGFMDPPDRNGRPAIIVSHGTTDTVLPIDQASRLLVPRLRAWGYSVRFEEFTGGHTVPETILRLSLETLKA